MFHIDGILEIRRIICSINISHDYETEFSPHSRYDIAAEKIE